MTRPPVKTDWRDRFGLWGVPVLPMHPDDRLFWKLRRERAGKEKSG